MRVGTIGAKGQLCRSSCSQLPPQPPPVRDGGLWVQPPLKPGVMLKALQYDSCLIPSPPHSTGGGEL